MSEMPRFRGALKQREKKKKREFGATPSYRAKSGESIGWPLQKGGQGLNREKAQLLSRRVNVALPVAEPGKKIMKRGTTKGKGRFKERKKSLQRKAIAETTLIGGNGNCEIQQTSKKK